MSHRGLCCWRGRGPEGEAIGLKGRSAAGCIEGCFVSRKAAKHAKAGEVFLGGEIETYIRTFVTSRGTK